MFFTLLFLCALLFTGIQKSRAAYYQPSGVFMSPSLTPAVLLAAVNGDAAAIAQFDNISQDVNRVAVPAPGNSDPGGQAMLKAILNAIQAHLGIMQTIPPAEVTAQAFSAVTNANPGVLTYTGDDNFVDGESILINGTGVPDLDGHQFIIANVNTGAKTFELQGIDTTAFAVYGGTGGTITTPAIDFLTKAVADGFNGLKRLQAALVQEMAIAVDGSGNITSQGTIAAAGYKPGLNEPPPISVKVTNVGVQAIGWMLAGSNQDALRTLGLASECTVASCSAEAGNAKLVVGAIFTHCELGVPPPIQCKTDNSTQFLQFLPQAMMPVIMANKNLCTPNPSGPCTPLPLSQIINIALDGSGSPDSVAAGTALSTGIYMFLNGLNPCPPGVGAANCKGANDPTATFTDGNGNTTSAFIGYPAVAWLQNVLDAKILPEPQTNPVKDPPKPPDAGALDSIKQLPMAPGGVHNIPSPGANTADPPCKIDTDYVAKDIKIRKANDDNIADWSDGGGHNPCQFTRDHLMLDFARNFKAGEQWAAYFPYWVQSQWMPALRNMAAQWSAAIISQTLLYGAAMDANNTASSGITIQVSQVEAKMNHMPSESTCTAASVSTGKGAGITTPANAMTRAWKYEMQIEAGLGTTATP